MAHRVREAVRRVSVESMGGTGSICETDETKFGYEEHATTRAKKGKRAQRKRTIISQAARGGSARVDAAIGGIVG